MLLYVWVGDQRHAQAALPPVKSRYPLYRRLGGPQGRSGRVRKIYNREVLGLNTNSDNHAESNHTNKCTQ
jgi:hypothetical protein